MSKLRKVRIICSLEILLVRESPGALGKCRYTIFSVAYHRCCQYEARKHGEISLDTKMDTNILSLPQSDAPSSLYSMLPSDSIWQVASTLSDPDASLSQHAVKRRKLRATLTWDHFRGAQGDESRIVSGRLLHYCMHRRNLSWSTHISSNA